MSTIARMADSINVNGLPPNLEAYAGYVDGPGADFDLIVERFYPHAHCLSITRQGGIAACADFEPGCMAADQAGPWVKTMIRLGHWRPVCYAALEEDMPAVKQSLADHGLLRSQYRLWVADANGDPRIPAGYDAKQYLFANGFDLSVLQLELFPGAPEETQARTSEGEGGRIGRRARDRDHRRRARRRTEAFDPGRDRRDHDRRISVSPAISDETKADGGHQHPGTRRRSRHEPLPAGVRGQPLPDRPEHPRVRVDHRHGVRIQPCQPPRATHEHMGPEPR